MQMSKTYESRDRKRRAHQARLDAQECEAAGYKTIAQINRDMAAFLDPFFEREDV